MKKIFLFLLILLLPIMVNAEEVGVKTLIPVDTKVSVNTEKFNYNNFVYNSNVDSKGNSLITFESIKNNTISKLPISINILLFNNDQKNIGFVTYCTDKDLNSNYSGYKLVGGNSVDFSISVVSKYFVDGSSSKDVKYIAVLDENKYCQIGGYDRYEGLTIDEIVNGVSSTEEKSGIDKVIDEVKEKNLLPVIVIVLISIAGLVILLMIISSIVKKAKNKKITTNFHEQISEPVEETLDLSYSGNIDDSLGDSSNSISMGDANDVIDNSDNSDNDNLEEDDTDLTSLFK